MKLCPSCKEIKLSYFILIFASVHFLLSHLPNFNSISVISLAATVLSLTYSTIGWTAALAKEAPQNLSYGRRGVSTLANVFNFFNALGGIAFACAGHNVVLEIQATIPSTSERKAFKETYVEGSCFGLYRRSNLLFLVAFIGHYVFGNTVDDNIMITLEKPSWPIACANMFVFIHVTGGYQVYAMPVFDMLETLLVKKMKFKLRFTTRTLFVGITMFIAVTFPFFGVYLDSLVDLLLPQQHTIFLASSGSLWKSPKGLALPGGSIG